MQGEWKLITTSTSPNFWQGLSFPNSSSSAEEKGTYVAALRASLKFGEQHGLRPAHERMQMPARPYPRMMPCSDQSWDNQSWAVDSERFPSTPASICSTKGADAGLCWNVQGGHSTDRLILFTKSEETNSLFSLKDGHLWNPLLPASGCVGAHAAGGELVLLDDCAAAAKDGAIVTGFHFDASTGHIKAAAGDMCVTASCCTNSTGGGHGHSNADSGPYLFNVVEDPTEQVRRLFGGLCMCPQ